MVIGTDCTGSWKSNYHMITTTTAPSKYWIFCRKIWLFQIKIYFSVQNVFKLKTRSYTVIVYSIQSDQPQQNELTPFSRLKLVLLFIKTKQQHSKLMKIYRHFNWLKINFYRYGILIDPIKVVQMLLSEPYSWPNVLLLFCKYHICVKIQTV